MKFSRSQIERFLSGECNEREAADIHAYLSANPHLLDEYFDEGEWEAFSSENLLGKERSEQLLDYIRRHKRSATKLLKMRRWMQAAVLVLAVSGLAWLVAVINRHMPGKEEKKATLAVAAKDTLIRNSTRAVKTCRLEDSSVVELGPGSEIALQQPFGKNNRNIRITGEAVFRVAPDKAKPFTVYAADVATTALGTVFKIEAHTADSRVSVKLLEGKVMVQNLQRKGEVAYLLPGQSCVFDRTSASLGKAQMDIGGNTGNAPGPRKESGALEFSNLPLPAVFDILAERYGVSIACDSQALAKRKFSGVFRKDASLEEILNTISVLNDVSVNKKGNNYQIVLLP